MVKSPLRLSLEKINESLCLALEEFPKQIIQSCGREREIRIGRPERSSKESRDDTDQTNGPVEASIAIRTEQFLHGQSPPECSGSLKIIPAEMPEAAIVRTPKFHIRGRHHKQHRSGFHRMDQITNKCAVILDMLENIRKQDDVRVCHFPGNILRRQTMNEPALREPLLRERHGLRDRFDARTIVIGGKEFGVPARA